MTITTTMQQQHHRHHPHRHHQQTQQTQRKQQNDSPFSVRLSRWIWDGVMQQERSWRARTSPIRIRSHRSAAVMVLAIVAFGCCCVLPFAAFRSSLPSLPSTSSSSQGVTTLRTQKALQNMRFIEDGDARREQLPSSGHDSSSSSSYIARNLAQQQQQPRQSVTPQHNQSAASTNDAGKPPSSAQLKKILYIVTSMNEFETGKRHTQRGADRYKNTVVPVISESVNSMLQMGYAVDVVLIADYSLKHARRMLLRNALPTNTNTTTSSIQVTFWNDATPLGYKMEDATMPNAKHKANRTQYITRALARQHRFVIKDKLLDYDFFVCFEDDMIIKGPTIQNYVDMEAEIYRLRQMAPYIQPRQFVNLPREVQVEHGTPFYGPLTKDQLKRIIPGFIRVEVLLDEARYGAQDQLDPVPMTDRPLIDPDVCCSITQDGLDTKSNAHAHTHANANDMRPPSPASDQLVLWETNIKALGVRKMPPASTLFDWVVLQRGPRYLEWELYIADYWSNHKNKYYQGEERPDEKDFLYVNNQGGWMATRRQVWEWHTEICSGGFLPPFSEPHFPLDGLDMRNVEYWSGGLQLFTREHGCNLQRIISLHPDHVAKQLLYHSSNNKQRQLHKRRWQIVKVNDLFAQLNTVKQNAEQAMAEMVAIIQYHWSRKQHKRQP